MYVCRGGPKLGVPLGIMANKGAHPLYSLLSG